jgi:Cys-tRNA(Pro) deacylase
MIQKLQSKAIEYLEILNIPFELFIHTEKIKSLQDAAKQRGQSDDQVLRSILFRSKDHQFYMVVTTGTQQINWKILRNYLETNRTSMATEEEVFKETGYQLGTVNPFGLKSDTKIFINKPCLNQNIISVGSGIRGVAIIMTINDLLKALPNAIIENFSE